MPNHPLFEEPFAGLTLVKWLGIVCCAYACIRLLQDRRRPVFLGSWQARCFLTLLALSTISYLALSKTDGLSFSPMFSYVSYALLFFTTVALVNTYERFYKTLLAALAGATWASLYVIREFQASGGMNLRPGYVAGDSNYFATCTVLVIPIAVYMLRMKGSRWERWFCGVSLVLMLLAFTLASSRGGLFGLCVAAAYMLLRSARSRRLAVLITVLLLPLLWLSPASPLARMLHPSFGDVMGEQIRRDFWRVGLEMIRKHPITGIGLGNFTAISSTKVGAQHGIACNTFLEITAELGIPGLIAYCGIVLGAISHTSKLRAAGKMRRDRSLLYAAEGIQAGLIGFSAAAVFVSAEYQKPFWVMIAVTATIPMILTRKLPKATCGKIPRRLESERSLPAPQLSPLAS
ncbi:MAG: O-antigen ligase family protein [Acidobacteria bacterium]|nr:O-antigen ligase family protein [Acidobacteriota bacterium]